MADKRAPEATEEAPESKRSNEQKPFVVINDGFEGYSTDTFTIPQHYQDSLERILLPHGVIMDRVSKMARDIVEDFGSEPLTCLCVLKGGHQFFADLFDKIKQLNESAPKSLPLRVDFIRAKSYEDDHSTGKVQIIGGDNMQTLKGCNVLIVEDMIDTGKTMIKLLSTLRDYQPKSLKVASLFVKRTPLSNGYKPHYIGFEVPNHFVVGYALDYNEHFRDLAHVAILNDHGKDKYKSGGD
eukprot:m.225455 g.225455  ORF g.225455 m.225455 type:complete len:240 (-) comp17308_c0_seq3:3834-4553(-)